MKYHIEFYERQSDGRVSDSCVNEEEVIMEHGFLPNAGDSVQPSHKKAEFYKVISRHFGFFGDNQCMVQFVLEPLTQQELVARVSEA